MGALVLWLSVAGAAPPARTVDALGDPLPSGALARLGTTRLPFSTSRLLLLPDGKTGAFEEEGTVHVFDVKTGKDRLRLAMPKQEWAGALACSADSRLIAAVGYSGEIRAWSTATGRVVFRVTDPRRDDYVGDTRRLVFTSDGRYLVHSSPTRPCRRWDLRTGEEAPWPEAVRRLPFTLVAPDGRLGACLDREQRLAIWDVAGGKAERQIDLPKEQRVNELALSPDGRKAAVDVCREDTLRVGPYGRMLLFDLRDGTSAGELAGHRWVRGLAFLPDGRSLLTSDGDVRLWEIATGEVRNRLDLGGEMRALDVTADGSLVAVQGWARSRQLSGVAFWHPLTAETRPAGELTGAGSRFAFSPDGRCLLAGDVDGDALLWDVGRFAAPALASPSDEELSARWGRLLGDSSKAHSALCDLAGAGDRAVTLMAKRLAPVPPASARRIGELVGQLDDDEFAVRTSAFAQLAALGEVARDALERAAKDPPSVEMRKRAAQLRERLRQPTGEQLRSVRAAETLERIGTIEARALLKRLAAGEPGAPLTRQAGESLRRLED